MKFIRKPKNPAQVVIKGNNMAGFMDSWLDETVNTIESTAKEYGSEYLPEKIYDQAEDYLKNKAVADLEEKAGDILANEVSKYTAQDSVQDKGITSSVNAVANQASEGLINMKNSWKAGTFLENYKPLVFGSAGVTGLLFLKWLIGKKRVEKVYVKNNK